MPKRKPTSGSFKPGNRIGAKGRPPRAVEEARLSVLARCFDEPAEERAVQAMMAKAEGGSVAAFCALMDRKYGRPAQTIDLSGSVLNITAADLRGKTRDELEAMARERGLR